MKIFWTLLFAGFLATTVIGQTGSVSGSVNYKNYLNSQITSNCVVNLYQNSVLVGSVAVNNTGWYSFDNLQPGTYQVTANCTGPVGGINAVDAIMVLVAFIQQLNPPLDPLNKLAADANGSGGIPNTSDALAISSLFVGMVPNFMPPYTPSPGGSPWLSESFTVVLAPGQAATQNLKVLCRGDVNGSHIP